MAINWTDKNTRRNVMPFILNRRLFTDATQTKVLEDGDAGAAYLIGGKGTALTDDVAKKYGLDDSHRLREDKEEDAPIPEKEPDVEVQEEVAEAPESEAKTEKPVHKAPAKHGKK